MYTNDGQEQALTLNIWGRDAPEQGTYLLTNIPFATHPLRLGVGDAAEMRQVPDEFDGIEPDSPTLPPTFVFLSGIGVIVESDANRKGCTVSGFTYLNKKHGWQKWSLRLEFEDTARWAAWTVPGTRSLVTFDALMIKKGTDGLHKCYIRRITAIADADRAILAALNVGSPGGGDRAERLRRAREAKRLALEKREKQEGEGGTSRLSGEDAGSHTTQPGGDNKGPALPENEDAADDPDDVEEPVTPIGRKGRRAAPKADLKGKGKEDAATGKRTGKGKASSFQDSDGDSDGDGDSETNVPGNNDEEDGTFTPPARKVRRTGATSRSST